MDNIFKDLFDRALADEPHEKAKKKRELQEVGEFNPDDPYYDPQTRLKRRLKSLFPHLPVLPGLPPSLQSDEHERES